MKKASILIWLVVLTIASPAFGQSEKFFVKNPPGTEPMKFLSEALHQGLCPHGQLAFAPDGSGVFWSAIALEGRQMTIYWCAFDGKEFSPPVIAPFAAVGNGGPAFSPDGRRLFFNVEITGPDATSPKTMAIAYVEKSGSGWTKPALIESTTDTLMTKGQVSVARSGNIYFVGRILTERTPAIFVCRFADGRYSPPVKLAGPIAELPLVADPWIDPDERFLLVSSPPAEGPPMLTDIGISSPSADGTWSKPVRLSGPVNTPTFERFAALSSDGKYLFFIRASGQQFVSDQARFFWVETKDIPELQAKVSALSGPYLGQRPPGMTPEVFAPGVVSRDGIQMKLTMTANGSEILYTERDPATNAASFILRSRVGDSWSEPVALPYSKVYMDIEPSLSPDGMKILFVSNRPASGEGEPGKIPDIWMAEKIGDQWGPPVRLGPPIFTNDPADIEAHPAFLPDGGIYFMRQNGKTRRLFQAARRGDRFAEPVAIPLKEDLLAFQFSGPCFSPDGRTMLMHSRKEAGFGNWDLYVAFKDESGGWSELRNLGPAVNTDKPESSPTFSSDGQYIFFTRETDLYWVSAEVLDELRPAQSEQGGFPVLKGPYLGQELPGMTPGLFAPDFVSTKYGELNSVFSPDGKEFYFSRREIPGKPSALMVTRMEGDRWTEPQPLPFSGTYSDIDLFLCPDNQRLVFCSSRPRAGGQEDRMNHDFWVVRRDGSGWSEPEPFAPEAVSPMEDYYPVVTLSGTLYFNSQREGRATNDIYASKFAGGKYLPAEKLPTPINTEYREFDAFVAPDEQTIIFSSERPGGIGGSDIYVSFRDKKGGWSEPVNLGPEVNSARSEYGAIISPDGRYLFFTSSKAGGEDIYWVSAEIVERLRPRR